MPLFGRRRPETDEDEETERDDASDAETAPRGGVASSTTTLRDLLIVTYAVSVDKAKALVPEGLPLDKLPGPDGELTAFAQTLVAYHEDARWSPLPGAVGASFHQISYRLLTRLDGKKGAFEVRTFTSSSELHITQRALHRSADYARMTLFIDGNPARAQYRSYTVRASGDLGKTELDVNVLPDAPTPPAPFSSTTDMVSFLADRDEIYFRASAPKDRVRRMVVDSGAYAPLFGEVTYARLTTWTELGLLASDDLMRPLAVVIQPALPVVARTPRLAKLVRPAAPTTPSANGPSA
jgi:hypothetical protein